jgi:hypothetical protein
LLTASRKPVSPVAADQGWRSKAGRKLPSM